MSLIDKLNNIINCKNAIRDAINNKGGVLTESSKLKDYATAIDNLTAGGGSENRSGLIEVKSLPDNKYDTTSIYTTPYKFNDILISAQVKGAGNEAILFSKLAVELGAPLTGCEVVDSLPTENIVETTQTSGFYFYYSISNNEAYLYSTELFGGWKPLSEFFCTRFDGILMPCKGFINSKLNGVVLGHGYYIVNADDYYKYFNIWEEITYSGDGSDVIDSGFDLPEKNIDKDKVYKVKYFDDIYAVPEEGKAGEYLDGNLFYLCGIDVCDELPTSNIIYPPEGGVTYFQHVYYVKNKDVYVYVSTEKRFVTISETLYNLTGTTIPFKGEVDEDNNSNNTTLGIYAAYRYRYYRSTSQAEKLKHNGQELNVTPSTENQEFETTGNNYYSRVTVEPVTSTIDTNIVPENIAKDVTILGVTGTLSIPNGKKEITNTEEVDVSNYATAQVIDDNLTPNNIIKGVTILGIAGTGGIDISENIKFVSNSNDIISSEINKLCILNNNTNWKIISKTNGNLANLTTLDTTLPWQKLGGSCCATYGNYIYIFGGVYLDDETSKMVYTNNIYKFDCTNQTIETISTTLPKNMAYASCVTYKNNIYIFGGYNASTNFSTIYKFNCINERISTLSKTIPSRKYEKMSSVLYNDKIYLFGSFLNRSTNTKSDILIFNLANESWASTAYEKLPIYTMQPGSAVYNDNLYLFGGTDTVNGTTNTIYKFNLGNWTLTTLETTLPKSSRESSCFLFDDNIYILGGGYSDVHQFGCINEQITTLSVKCSFSNCGSIFKDYIYTFSDTKINKFQIPFTLLKNNILIHSGDSSYSLDIIPEKVTLPVKNVYIGGSNNAAEFASAYLYDQSKSAWVNVNTGEVLTL